MKRKKDGRGASWEYRAKTAMSAERKRKMQIEADIAETEDDPFMADLASGGCSCQFCRDAVAGEWLVDNE